MRMHRIETLPKWAQNVIGAQQREAERIKARVCELVIEGLWIGGAHHKQWYIEQIALCLSIDLEQIDHEMARAGNVDREPGIAP